MVATPHALVGAAASHLTVSPSGAFCAGVISHLLSDRIPHSDYNCFSPAGAAFLASDLGTAAVLLRLADGDNLAIWGAIGGITPDLISAPGRRLALPGTRTLTRIHDLNHTRRDLGGWSNVIVQTALSAAALAFLLKHRNN